ncbi:hypothetical protein [Paraburkholderia sp. BCC1886]|uniref:hypothetical protein n=1 Tax=Paraburkholderia sp. BCC1886 TaxID=2562670 RepID=UPI001183A7A0|nr:hypothetical protein [Paraburkholderia sp. BCC1886]
MMVVIHEIPGRCVPMAAMQAGRQQTVYLNADWPHCIEAFDISAYKQFNGKGCCNLNDFLAFFYSIKSMRFECGKQMREAIKA